MANEELVKNLRDIATDLQIAANLLEANDTEGFKRVYVLALEKLDVVAAGDSV